LVKKLGECWLASLITNHQLIIKQIPNINEYNKTNSAFPGFVLCHVLVVCCLMMVRDTCIILSMTVESIVHSYQANYCLKVNWTLKLLQYRYPYLDPYAKQIKVHLMLLHVPRVTKTGKLAKKTLTNWKWFPKVFYRQSSLPYVSRGYSKIFIRYSFANTPLIFIFILYYHDMSKKAILSTYRAQDNQYNFDNTW